MFLISWVTFFFVGDIIDVILVALTGHPKYLIETVYTTFFSGEKLHRS